MLIYVNLYKFIKLNILFLFILLILISCGTFTADQRKNSLESTTFSYQSALRWGYYETVVGFFAPELAKNGVPNDFKNLRIAGVDVAQPLILRDQNTALQALAIEYLYEDRQIVRKVLDQQVWRWDQKTKRWLLHSGWPKFTPQ